jgi:hypothetical protein
MGLAYLRSRRGANPAPARTQKLSRAGASPWYRTPVFPKVNTRDVRAVLSECHDSWRSIAGPGEAGWLDQAFMALEDAFAGRHPDFEALDARYHDLEHTMQGTLCLARLLRGWHHSGSEPALDARTTRLGLTAILFHDTGYLKPRGDRVGTGAKFTPIHVQRSAEFAGCYLRSKGAATEDVEAVQNMIRCTGINAKVRALRFHTPLERKVGCALATADLLGQMAADDYVAKLPILYSEFAEAAARNGVVPNFTSADDLVRQTPYFWRRHVLPRLEQEFEGTFRYLNQPWPDGPNEYLERVERQIALIPEPA